MSANPRQISVADPARPMTLPSKAIAVVLAATGGLIGWLPWLHVGAGRRDSYGLFRAAQRLGFDQITPARVLWYLVPVVAIASVVALLAGYPRLGLALLSSESVIVGVVSVSVVLVGASPGVTLAVGPWSGAVLGVLGLVFAAWVLVPGRLK